MCSSLTQCLALPRLHVMVGLPRVFARRRMVRRVVSEQTMWINLNDCRSVTWTCTVFRVRRARNTINCQIISFRKQARKPEKLIAISRYSGKPTGTDLKNRPMTIRDYSSIFQSYFSGFNNSNKRIPSGRQYFRPFFILHYILPGDWQCLSPVRQSVISTATAE